METGNEETHSLPKDLVRRFLIGVGSDNQNRKLNYVLNYSDDQLETIHDYIQWLFPTDVPSKFNQKAPVLSIDEFLELRRERSVQLGVKQAFFRMLKFYGLTYGPKIERGSNWDTHSWWIKRPTHNDLRITRIIRALTLFGLTDEADRFIEVLLRLHAEDRVDKEGPITDGIGRNATDFWVQARII